MKANTVRKPEPATLIPFPGSFTLTDRQIDNRIDKIEALKAQEAELEAKRKALEAEVKMALGDKEDRKTKRYVVTYKWEVRHILDRKRLDADYPGLYEEYKTRESKAQKFNYKPVKA